MKQNLEDSILQIQDNTGKSVGTGFVLSRDLIVTSSHVIKQAGSNFEKEVNLSLLNNRINIIGLVEHLHDDEDVAFIRVKQLPHEARPLKLGLSKQSEGHKFSTIGFPKFSGKAEGRRASGEIQGLLPEKTGNINLLQITSDLIEEGFSGAPVLDELSGNVVGMVQWGHKTDYRKFVHATPSETIAVLFNEPLALADAVTESKRNEEEKKSKKYTLIFGLAIIAVLVSTLYSIIKVFTSGPDLILFGLIIIIPFITMMLFFWFGYSKSKNIKKIWEFSHGQWVDKEIYDYSSRYPGLDRRALKFAYVLLMVTVSFGGWIISKVDEFEKKTIVIVTDIQGPEVQSYRVTETIIEELNRHVSNLDSMQVRFIPVSINDADGKKAINIGTRYLADMVLWGRYARTDEMVRLTLHVENIDASQRVLPIQGTDVRWQTATEKLDSFILQDDIAADMSALSLSIAGMALYEDYQYDQAQPLFDQAIHLNELRGNKDNIARMSYYSGICLYYMRDYEEAIDRLSQSIVINKNFSPTYFYRGLANLSLQKHQLAINDFTQALTIDPSRADYLDLRGLSYEQIGQFENAISDYTKALEVDSQSAILYYHRAFAYLKLGQDNLAVPDLQMVVNLSQDNELTTISQNKLDELNINEK